MSNVTVIRIAFVAVLAIGLFGAFLVAAIPAQAALPAADAYQATVVPPDVEVTVVVPDTGGDADNTTATIPTWALILAGIVVLALIAIAAGAGRATHTHM